MNLNKFAGWELKETSDVKKSMYKRGNYIHYIEYVNELWVNHKISGLFSKDQVVVPRQIVGRMIWVDNNKYGNTSIQNIGQTERT